MRIIYITLFLPALFLTSTQAFSISKISNPLIVASTSHRKYGQVSPIFSLSEDKTFAEEKEATKNESVSSKQTFTVTFPTLLELQEDVRRGDFVASSPIQVQCPEDKEKMHEFRVLLYPRGGGHVSSNTADKNINNNDKEKGGFGINLQRDDPGKDRVGVYLQYVPSKDDNVAPVDATFNLRLKGQQASGPKFDLDWTAGIRFVGPSEGKLRDGTANDFGCHIMQSWLLDSFLGGEEANNNLQVDVTIQLHSPPPMASTTTLQTASNDEEKKGFGNLLSFEDIRKTDQPGVHNAENVRVGKIIVPVLQKLSQRPRMFSIGAYPGVEYRIMRILDPVTGEDIFTSVPGADYEIRPIYPLVPQLERQWPVRVNEKDMPRIFTTNMYNAVSAIGSLFTAVTGLATAFIISQLVSFFFIPSKSMDPTLRVGDVLFVEKVTPRLLKNPSMGNVVLFNPNDKLQEIVKKSGGRITDRDLFVKRVAAGPGDLVSVDATGAVKINGEPAKGKRDLCEEEPLKLIQRYVTPMENQEIAKGEVFVLGDCSGVSVDSRVWGPLKNEDIVGRPILRIWPLDDRWGSISGLPASSSTGNNNGPLVTEWNN